MKAVSLDDLKSKGVVETQVKRTDDGYELPTGKFLVVDTSKLGQSSEAEHILWRDNAVVGEIEYPLDFCPLDVMGGRCVGSGDSFSMHPGPPLLWYHSTCYRPTRSWWHRTFTSIVQVAEGVTLPWRSDD